MNLFKILQKLDLNDYQHYCKNSADKKELDGVLGYPLLRWMSACKDDEEHSVSVELVNEIANKGYFSIHEHKELQFKLLAASGIGRPTKREWIKPPKRYSNKKLENLFFSVYPHLDEEDLNLWIEQNGKQGVKELCLTHGVQEKEMKEILRDL